MPFYRCEWLIDIDADTPQEAARLARSWQLDRLSLATVFAVTPIDGAGDACGDPISVDVGRGRVRPPSPAPCEACKNTGYKYSSGRILQGKAELVRCHCPRGSNVRD